MSNVWMSYQMKAEVAEEVFLNHILSSLVEEHWQSLEIRIYFFCDCGFYGNFIGQIVSSTSCLFHNKSFIIPTFVTSNLRHLAVADKCVMLDVKIPHLHEILFPRVHVREVVDHLWRLDSEPSLANYQNQTMSGKRKMMHTGSVWYWYWYMMSGRQSMMILTGSVWSSISSLDRIACGGMGRQVVLKISNIHIL